MDRRAFVLLAGTLALAACVQSPGGSSFRSGVGVGALSLGPAQRDANAGAPARIALLAPMSGAGSERGQALVNAAKLALDGPGAPTLDVRDTGGTAQGAAQAAGAAIAGGAGLIIGPLTAAETSGAAGVARRAGVPILAFTNDRAQAQPGVWTLGITPGQQVRRMVGAMLEQGHGRFAALLPQSEFGTAMGAALTQAASSAGAPPPTIKAYAPNATAIEAALRELTNRPSRIGPLLEQLRASGDQGDEAARQKTAELASQDAPVPSFDALLLAETGGRLATITGLLPTYDVAPPAVRVLGPALWQIPAARGSADLGGAWFAAPDAAARGGFDQLYTSAYGAPAPGYADFAFDAAAVARVLAGNGGYTVVSLCRPDGYSGVDGVFALQPDGTVRRGLAVFEVQAGGPQMIQPAPTNMAAPGI